MNLEKVKHGLIFIWVQDWIRPNANKAMEGWKCKNGAMDCPEATGGRTKRRAKLKQHDNRNLKGNPNKCDNYLFKFAIDGKITSYDQDAWAENMIHAQCIVTLWMLLDDPNYTGGKEKDVEVAFRITGCGRETTWSLMHIY